LRSLVVVVVAHVRVERAGTRQIQELYDQAREFVDRSIIEFGEISALLKAAV
jgi:hypothetical protein